MNLLLHHIKKDARHLWVLVALWLALLLGQTALVIFSAGAAGTDWGANMVLKIGLSLLPMLQGLMFFVFVPLLVQQESGWGTTAYWFTRPLSPQFVLLSKGVTLGVLFLLLPAVLESLIFVMHGVSWNKIPYLWADVVLINGAMVISFAVVAAATPNFGKYIVFLLVLLVATVLWSAVAAMANIYSGEFMACSDAPYGVEATAQILGHILTLAAGAGLVWYQYQLRPVWAVKAGYVLMIVLGFGLDWGVDRLGLSFFRDPSKPAAIEEAMPSEVGLKLRHSSVDDDYAFSRKEKEKMEMKRVRATLRMVGLPDGYHVEFKEAKGWVEGEQGERVDSSVSSYGWDWSRRKYHAIAHALDQSEIIGEPISKELWHEILKVPLSFALQSQNKKVKIDVEATYDVLRFEKVAEMDLRAGAKARVEEDQFVVQGVTASPGHLLLPVRHMSVRLLTEGKTNQDRRRCGINEDKKFDFVLWNPQRKEMIPSKDNFDIDPFSRVLRLNVKQQALSFEDETQLFLTEDWLAQAKLVIVAPRKIGETKGKLLEEKVLGESYWREDDGQEGKVATADVFRSIPFPTKAQATSEKGHYDREVARYVYRIYGLLDNAADEGKTEAFESLKSLGREYLDLFIRATKNHRQARDVAKKLVEALAEDQDMALILSRLKDHQWLVTVVRNRGWAPAARDILLEGIRGDCPCRLGAWLETLLSLKDPATYPDILSFFSKHGDEESYRLLKAMPEVGLQYEHVLSAWNARWNNKNNSNYKSFLSVALENGILTAIDGVARFYNEMGKEKDDADKEIYNKIVTYFDVDLSGQEFWAWFHRNKDRFEYDAEKQMWRVSERKR